MIIGTKIEFENLADFILRDYLGNKYDSYIPFDVQAFAEDYLKLEISYTKFEQEQNIEGLRTGNGNSPELNSAIGYQMMSEFSMLGNIYADKFSTK